MGKYKTFGSLFNRIYRNDLNQNFIDIEADINAQKSRVDTIVASAGNSNTEIVDARGTYPVLRDRLTATETSLAENTQRFKNAWVDVKQDYGAKGDGVTDDTTAINNAFAYAFANNVNIFIPEGNYSVSNIRATARSAGIDITIFGNGKISLNDSNANKGIILTGNSSSRLIMTGIIIKGKDTYNITFPLELLYWDTAIVDAITIDTFQHNGITMGNGRIYEIKNCTILNCGDLQGLATSASPDYINDGIYIHDAKVALFENNYIVNDISANTIYCYGRCGITCEYNVDSVVINNNYISGYSRGIHIEVNTMHQNAIVENNRLIGNCTGIIVWNNNTGILKISNNYISNSGALKSKSLVNKYAVDSTGTFGWAILFLGNGNDYKTVIKDNICKGTYDTTLILQNGLNMDGGKNITDDTGATVYKYKEWFFIENNLFDCGILGVKEMTEGNIPTITDQIGLYFINSIIKNNKFNYFGKINIYTASTYQNTLVEENTLIANGTSGEIVINGLAISKTGAYADIPDTLLQIIYKKNVFITKTSASIGFTLRNQQNNEFLTFSENSILNYGVAATKQPMFFSNTNTMINKTMKGNTVFDHNEIRVVGTYAGHQNSWAHSVGFASEFPSTIVTLDTTLTETSRSKMFGYNKKLNKKFSPSKTSVYTIGYFYVNDLIYTYDGNIGWCTGEGYYTQKAWAASTSMSNSYNNNNPLVFSGSRCFLCTVSGTTGASVPATFSTANVGDTITDGTVTWQYVGTLGTFAWNK